jgi:hypothetical protein
MRVLMVTWILALLIAGPTMAQSNTCMQAGVAGQVAEGRLALGRFRDAADRPETAYILLLATPTCLSASDPDEAVQSTSELHIYSSQNSVHRSLQKLVGRQCWCAENRGQLTRLIITHRLSWIFRKSTRSNRKPAVTVRQTPRLMAVPEASVHRLSNSAFRNPFRLLYGLESALLSARDGEAILERSAHLADELEIERGAVLQIGAERIENGGLRRRAFNNG